MKRLYRSVAFGVCLGLMSFSALMSGCASTGGAAGGVSTKIVSKLPVYSGPQARIRLADFAIGPGASTLKDEAPDGPQTIAFSAEQQGQIVGGLKELLQQALFNTNRFQVLGREESYSSMKSEFAQGDERWVKKKDRVQKGNVLSPDLVIRGQITKWAPDAGGRNIGLGTIAGKFLDGGLRDMSVGSKKSEVGLILQIFDMKTQRMLGSVPATGVATKKSLSFGGLNLGSSTAQGGVFSEYKNTSMEDALAQAVIAAVDQLAVTIPKKYFKHS